GRARRRPWCDRLLVRQEQGGLLVRHAAFHGLGRAQPTRVVLSWRWRGTLQRAYQRHPEDQCRRLSLLPDAKSTARVVQKGDEIAGRLQGHEIPHGGPLGRPVQGNGSGGYYSARW